MKSSVWYKPKGDSKVTFPAPNDTQTKAYTIYEELFRDKDYKEKFLMEKEIP
jgi:hypothetical protein